MSTDHRAGHRTTTVVWLTAEQQTHWRSFREGVARLLAALEHELEAQSGLSTHEYEVLVRLSEAPDRTLRMAQLADNLAHSRSRLTHTIRRMEEPGLVARAALRVRRPRRELHDDRARAGRCSSPRPPGTCSPCATTWSTCSRPSSSRALGDAMETVRVHLTGGACHVEWSPTRVRAHRSVCETEPMVATTIHLMRHGEVHNPEGVLYGRLPGYRLSERGLAMARDGRGPPRRRCRRRRPDAPRPPRATSSP